jgi:RimJ/RimL family protein N-acetyltransferase
VTEAPLVVFAVPDRFEIDGPFVAHVVEDRDISERVLERAGFTREGTKRRLLRHSVGRADATLFSLLPDE